MGGLRESTIVWNEKDIPLCERVNVYGSYLDRTSSVNHTHTPSLSLLSLIYKRR